MKHKFTGEQCSVGHADGPCQACEHCRKFVVFEKREDECPAWITPDGRPLEQVAPALCDTFLVSVALPVGFVYGPVLDKRRPPEGWLELKGQIETAYDYPQLRALAVVEWPEPKVQERFGFAAFRLPYHPHHWIKAKP
jgi:hypothetical protein